MVPTIKKILYATDLGENSSYAFYHAVSAAKALGAKITILYALEPPKEVLKQTFLGSVSHGVLQRSRRPVFIVPIPSNITGWDLKP